MNPKQLKYLSLFEQMSQSDPLSDTAIKKFMPAFLNLDYALAAEAWDYLCTTREDKLAADPKAALALGGNVFDMFYKKAAQKAVKTLADLPAVRRAVYQYSPTASENTAFNVMIDLLNSNKTDAAEEIFKCLVKNENIKYGAFMKALLERLFIEILKKNPSKKIEMSRKLSTLLLAYVAKIKTDERAMLEQRIRETM